MSLKFMYLRTKFHGQLRIQKFSKGGDNLSAMSSFVANAHNELYGFTQKKAAFWKKILSQ